MDYYRLVLTIGGVEAIRTEVLDRNTTTNRYNKWCQLYPAKWITEIPIPKDSLLAY